MSFRNYYDSSHGRNRVDTALGRSTSSDKPTSVTAKYITPTSNYKSSSIPKLCRERSATRETESPITAIANRYANYKTSKDDKPLSKYIDKKDSYNKLTVPAVTSNRSRDVSPVSTSSKYSIGRTSRHLSPDRRVATPSLLKGRSRDSSPADREKDIPNKTDKTSGYNGLSSYKLYPRTSSYTRPASRTEIKPEVTVNRYAIANRLANNYLRTSPPEKSRTSLSPVNHVEIPKIEIDKATSMQTNTHNETIRNSNSSDRDIGEKQENRSDCEEGTFSVTVITRHTSPTPPGSSAYVRNRRADMAKTIEKVIQRPNARPQMCDKEIQSDRLDDPTRTCRFVSSARGVGTSWYPPSSNSYTGYAGRYSTQYLRDSTSSEKVICRSHGSESNNKDGVNIIVSDDRDLHNKNENDIIIENNPEIVTTFSENKEDDSSEIIINVNLKLKKAKNSANVVSSELVSPEITITNSQLPPQAPKVENATKTKKVKVRKSSTDSSSDSSKKKIVKKRSKSVSSTESDQSNDVNGTKNNRESNSVSPPKTVSQATSTKSAAKNGNLKLKKMSKSSSRESNSPESSVTISTQSSISEDETISKSKTHDHSRTSADEASIPLDRSQKQFSPASQPNEGLEESKSFLIRALAPVTNFFKARHSDSGDSKWLESSMSESTGKDISNLVTESDRSNKTKSNTDNIIASNDDELVRLKGIRHIDSGERAWWMDPEPEKQNGTKNIKDKQSSSERNGPAKIRHIESGERAWWMDKSESQSEQKVDCTDGSNPVKKCNFPISDQEEKPWWLDSSANIPEGIERLTPPRKTSTDSDKSEKFDFYKVRHVESGEKEWWLTSNENTSSSAKDSPSLSKSDSRTFPLRRLRHIESGERPWWLSSSKDIPEGIERLPTPPAQPDSDSSDSEEVEVYLPVKKTVPPFPVSLPDEEPLGDRRSPEGLETPREHENYGRSSPYENTGQYGYQPRRPESYISRCTDIDDILGTCGEVYSPFMDCILARRSLGGRTALEDMQCEEIDVTQVRIHDSTAQRPHIQKARCRNEKVDYHEEGELDDAALQVFKDGDYGPYLDLDSTLAEQEEELEGVQDGRKNAIVLRTQLSVRVHSIIGKASLLPKITDTLVKEATHHLGSLSAATDLPPVPFNMDNWSQMDTATGVSDQIARYKGRKDCFEICQERLLHSQGRELRSALFSLKQVLQTDKDLVHEFVNNKGLDCLMQVSTAADQNYLDYILRALGQILLYVDGMHGVMSHKRCLQWLYSLLSNKFRHVVKNALKLLLVFIEYTESNSLLLITAISAVDTAAGDQPWHRVMSILRDSSCDTELLIYASTLINRCLDNVMERDAYYEQVDAMLAQGMLDVVHSYRDRRETDVDLLRQLQIFEAVLLLEDGDEDASNYNQLDESTISSLRRRRLSRNPSDRRKSRRHQLNDSGISTTPVAETPQRPAVCTRLYESHLKENKELSAALRRRRNRFERQANHISQQERLFNNSDDVYSRVFGNVSNNSVESNAHEKSFSNGHQQMDDRDISTKNVTDVLANGNQRYTNGLKQRIQNGTLGHSVTTTDAIAATRLKRPEGTVIVEDDTVSLPPRERHIKELAQKLSAPPSPAEEKPARALEMSGIVSKAKEELAKSQSREIVKSPPVPAEVTTEPERTLSEIDIQWEQLRRQCGARGFILRELDFSELQDDDDETTPSAPRSSVAPPPPPPPSGPAPPAPPIAPPSDMGKNKKTIKLFWQEVAEAALPDHLKGKVGGLIWDELPQVLLDTRSLEHLFETRSNDINIKKMIEPKHNLILDTKRSNAINIAMKKLPTPQTIKAAIMKMDATVIGREGIEKLLSMLPTEEEKLKIQEAQYANPDLPLGSAEQFLLTLASISELSSRLKLWVFKLDFDNMEKEIAEPLFDLKQGMELLRANKTFKAILSTLRSVGNFLNGTPVKGFRLEYLGKVMEVKDTVHKHPLLYHICEMIIDKFPDSTDFFSEVGPVIRASKVDFDMLYINLSKAEADCKASWDHLKKVAKHDGAQLAKTKINEFLMDAAERIIMLTIIKKRVMNRYYKFLLHLGVPTSELEKTKPTKFLKVIAEFALEFRTTRERVLQQLEKRANHRERNKTRGKLIIDVGNYSNKNGDSSADMALKELLKSDSNSDSHKTRKKYSLNRTGFINGEIMADDEIIKSLVRSTAAPAPSRRDARRKDRDRLANRHNNLNRTLDGHQSWPGNL